MSAWLKVPHAPYYLEIRKGSYKTSYRVNFRGDGLDLRETLKGEFKSWKDALRLADKRIAEARFGEKTLPTELVRCELLCDQIVALKRTKDPATYKQAETFFRLHIKPFLSANCPYASQLNPTVWLAYKTSLRLSNPKVSLFNHWKFFCQLFRFAFEKGILKTKFKLDYSEAREDNRERGLVIPEHHFQRLVSAATPKHFGKIPRIQPKWRDRIILQWFTGMRPGEVRELRKDRWSLETHAISLRKEDTKTRVARSFVVSAEPALEVLTRRMGLPGPFFFPSEADPEKPMDKHLSGWRSVLRKAGLKDSGYTPHDLRHGFLTRAFKTGSNPALICYAAGLSLEEAQKTYLHFVAADTAALAKEMSGG